METAQSSTFEQLPEWFPPPPVGWSAWERVAIEGDDVANMIEAWSSMWGGGIVAVTLGELCRGFAAVRVSVRDGRVYTLHMPAPAAPTAINAMSHLPGLGCLAKWVVIDNGAPAWATGGEA